MEIGSGYSPMNLETAERVGKIRKDELVFPPEAQGTRARINWLHPASRFLWCQGDSARFGLTTWQDFTRVRNHIALLVFGSKIWPKKQAKQRSPWQTGALSHEARPAGSKQCLQNSQCGSLELRGRTISQRGFLVKESRTNTWRIGLGSET